MNRPSAVLAAFLLACLGTPSSAEVNQATLDSITTPDAVQTSIGTLRFIDGAPLPQTSAKVYDYLDTMRGVDTFLKGIPAASIYAIIHGTESLGAVEAHQIVLFDKLAGPDQIGLTYNNTTMYVFPTTDLERDGPTVIEVPPGALGALHDAYFRYAGDFGPAGQDKGKGGKYLILPPGYEGDVPDGYYTLDPGSYKNWILLRYSIADGMENAAAFIRDNLKMYPLSMADNPPEMEFISGSATPWNTVHANNFEFYNELNAVVQKEPIDFLDPETRGLFASIGIEKGKPFAPDTRMRKILEDAVAIGNASARSIVWYPRVDMNLDGLKLYPDRNYFTGFNDRNVFFNGDDGYTMNSDARVAFHYGYTVVTPAMATPRVGTGSDYAIAYVDNTGQPFDGSKTYMATLPPNPPARDFWAFTVYDAQTRSMLQTDQAAPSLDSVQRNPVVNADGSIDVYFAPVAPEGKEANWIQTIPGKSWFAALRMYGPLEPWIEQTWKPGDVMLVE
ncbi:DUF1254 domain-containing protein [Cyanobium sp. LEGE 06143]|nr:DUF1254 domain-containing protein [Cyanobium sp. LEGE 06143]MBE9171566.1 DUF1254 domain-containing protein [Cyanobium sp. LEGE 06143]